MAIGRSWCGLALTLSLGLSLGVMGCSKDKPPPKDPGKSWMDTLEQKNPGATPAVGDDDDDDDDDAADKPKPGATTPKPPPIELKQPSGRPAILMGPSASISSTFGATPGATLKLKAANGTITLRIEEYALPGGFNLDFKIDKGSVKKGPVVGSVAYLKIRHGDKVSASEVPTKGKDYTVSVPLGGKDSVNLAVGMVKTDSGGNEEGKPTWTIYPPTRVEAGFGEAVFSLKSIGPVMYLHATTAEATAAPAEGG